MEELKNYKYDQLEVARTIGEPLDPRKAFPDLVSLVCETETVPPEDITYYYDSLLETDKIITITTTGELTTQNITADEPALLSFTDISTPEYYVKITDLAKSKEATLARKMKTINRSLNMYENYYVESLLSAGATASSHTHTLQSGRTRFSYDDVILMLEDVVDFGDNYVLVVGSQVDQDMKLWDWNDNKYSSMIEAFKDLGIQKVRMPGSSPFEFTVDGPQKVMLNSNVAYLVALNTEMGKPNLFVRKQLNDIDMLGAAIKQNGDKPQRLVFASPNPIAVNVSGTAKRYLAVGLTGYEEIVAANTCPYAVAKFTRQ